jgi:hypothetical protein
MLVGNWMQMKLRESNLTQAILDVEVQGEFMGMESTPDGIDLLFVEPGLNDVLAEHIPSKQKVVILP